MIFKDSKKVKRVPSYAVFNMVDLLGRRIYSTKCRMYYIEDSIIISRSKNSFEKNFYYENR